MTDTPAMTPTSISLAERLRAFAEHLEPVSGDYHEEIGTIIEAATALDALNAREEAYREALRLHVAYEALPADRGGRNGPKGKAWAAFIAARDQALALEPDK